MVSASVFLDIVWSSISLLRAMLVLGFAWLFSHVAISGGSLAPEMPIVENQKQFGEYPVMRDLQNAIMDLQLLEIAMKNRRDPKLEEKLDQAITTVREDGHALANKLATLRTEQIIQIEKILKIIRDNSAYLSIKPESVDTAFASIRDGAFRSGEFRINGKIVLILNPFRVGRHFVWDAKLPTTPADSLWSELRAARTEAGVGSAFISTAAMAPRLDKINIIREQAEVLFKDYYAASYSRLHSAFEEYRFGVFHRIDQARRSLQQLSQSNSAMGVPEETAALYNQVLEHLFSYGVDISLADDQRDFSVQGFLFAPSPEESRRLLERLRFSPTAASYNSSSG